MRKLCALLFALCACTTPGEFISDGAAPLTDAGKSTDLNGSGDLAGAVRIVTEYYVIGTAKLPTLRFFDRQLGIGCFATQTAAGLRCAPSGLSAGYFSDAACTVRAATTPNDTGCPLDLYIRDAPSTCTGTTRIYLAVKQLRQANIYFKSGAACLASPLAPTSDLYGMGAEIDPVVFASMAVER